MRQCAPSIRRRSRTNGPTCFWMGSACACGSRRAASGCTCWSPTECTRTARANCWLFCAAREKASLPGKDCSILYRRGLQGENLLLIVTDGCPGLAAAIETVYPRVLHQRCWVHKMRNILDKVRRRDHDAVKADAQAIYRADSRRQAQAAFRAFRRRWQSDYGSMVRQLERDLPQLLSFFSFPRQLWRKLRTTNIIERCFVEVRRRTRPMVCFVNVQSVDRIIYSIFQRFNLEWKNRTLKVFTQAA